jgi:hypothetical protein
MTEPDQIVRIIGILNGGTANKGDIGFLDVNDAGRTIRLGMSHLHVPELIAALEELQEAVARERRKHQKQDSTRAVVAKQTETVKVGIDETHQAILLEFQHLNGTATFVAVKPEQVARMTSLMHGARAKVLKNPSKEPNDQ